MPEKETPSEQVGELVQELQHHITNIRKVADKLGEITADQVGERESVPFREYLQGVHSPLEHVPSVVNHFLEEYGLGPSKEPKGGRRFSFSGPDWRIDRLLQSELRVMQRLAAASESEIETGGVLGKELESCARPDLVPNSTNEGALATGFYRDRQNLNKKLASVNRQIVNPVNREDMSARRQPARYYLQEQPDYILTEDELFKLGNATLHSLEIDNTNLARALRRHKALIHQMMPQDVSDGNGYTDETIDELTRKIGSIFQYQQEGLAKNPQVRRQLEAIFGCFPDRSSVESFYREAFLDCQDALGIGRRRNY